MRLARGSGTGGLAAPRPIQLVGAKRVHLRPLLTLKKNEIYEHLSALKIHWREDSTNMSARFLRNRTRSQVIPAWLGANRDRDALGGASLSRELLEEDDIALDAWLQEIDPYTKTGALNILRLSGRPRALVRRALRHWMTLLPDSPRLSRQGFNALLEDVMRARPTQHSFGSGGFAKLTRSRLCFEPARRKLSN